MKSKTISTTIKAKWLDKIESGEKTVELKEAKEFWRQRLHPLLRWKGPIQIVFICGRYRKAVYQVAGISYHSVPGYSIDIDGKKVPAWYEIKLGDRIT